MSDIKFSSLIIGTMRLGQWGVNMSTSELEAFTMGCLDLGLSDFDHADIYGNYSEEENFGKVLKKNPGLRSKMQITTKYGIKMKVPERPHHSVKSYDASGTHMRQSVEQSLINLSTDYIDVLLIHRPDWLLNPYDTAETIEQLKKEGKVLHFGVSNFSPSQFDLLNSYTPLITNQIEASILHLEPFTDGTLDQMMKHKIVPTAWSPFGGGEIFGAGKDPRIKKIQETAQKMAQEHNCGLDDILLAWLVKHPSSIVPVLGTTKLDRVASSLRALEINLSKEEWYILLEASRGIEVA
jgi:predicted oxidoreductase